jgi:hypothetical protein
MGPARFFIAFIGLASGRRTYSWQINNESCYGGRRHDALRVLGFGPFRACPRALKSNVAWSLLHQHLQAFLFADITRVPPEFSCDAIDIRLVDMRTSMTPEFFVVRRKLRILCHRAHNQQSSLQRTSREKLDPIKKGVSNQKLSPDLPETVFMVGYKSAAERTIFSHPRCRKFPNQRVESELLESVRSARDRYNAGTCGRDEYAGVLKHPADFLKVGPGGPEV